MSTPQHSMPSQIGARLRKKVSVVVSVFFLIAFLVLGVFLVYAAFRAHDLGERLVEGTDN